MSFLNKHQINKENLKNIQYHKHIDYFIVYSCHLELGLCIGQNDRDDICIHTNDQYSIYHMISKVSIENK